ncbi:MAG: hypothetical protein GTO51_05390 [Candidatus Latescibacteria bacterium]|nr:hypothetical protein [Candidatus Latescibacterota bacterium]NIO28437.1 hypothetical protein [Candidatus Latescibacterota bacterium]NIO55986.1 hypothetical protein [Candidatus Latescibacterota bacterium]NIT01950.1 hypothetical protein [Candidatus Latescibacterota bacterium]
MRSFRSTQSLSFSLCFLVLVVLLIPSLALGKTPRRVPRVSSNLRVDGILSEDIWDKALVMELNYEVRPGENVPPPVRTEVLLAYSQSHFYAAFRAYDPDPSQIRARICDRDKMYEDDWVALVIDTFNDQRRMFDFFCNPLGIQGDQIECPECSEDSWDAIWESSGKITDEGYTVEMAIPFSSMRFQRTKGDQIWNFDAVRSYPRKVRHHIGLFPRDRNNNCYLCQAEQLIGFAGATPGKNVELDPTFSALYSQERPGFTEGDFQGRDKDFEPGLTARWGITPNMTLNATINPDFSQVEADVAQLDINTNFALFYPEKRPFFLEGTELFLSRFRVVHTRTLTDPNWGIKLTGKEGGHAVGFYTVQDKITNLLFPGSQGSESTTLEKKSIGTTLRYRRDIFTSSTVGILLTDRERGEYYNRVAGLDGLLKLTKKDQVSFQFLGSQTRYPDSIAVKFSQPRGRFAAGAYEVLCHHDTDGLDLYAIYRETGPKFRADLGFMPSVGTRYIDFGWAYTWFEDSDNWYTMINLGTCYETEEETGGTVLHQAYAYWFDYNGPLESGFHVIGSAHGKNGFNGREFDNREVQFVSYIQPTGSLELEFSGRYGNHIDFANTRPGRRLSLNPGIGYKLGRHLAMALDHTHERMNVNEDRRLYTANISQLHLVYQFNRRTFIRTILQYIDYKRDTGLYVDEVDPEVKHLFSQLLFSYKINPQTVLFVGYSDNYYGFQNINLIQTDRTLFVKIGYAWVL